MSYRIAPCRNKEKYAFLNCDIQENGKFCGFRFRLCFYRRRTGMWFNMKTKYSVIPFIPAFIAMLFYKLMGLLAVDGNGLFMGMNSMQITYTVIGISVALFVVCVIINLFDRKTAPVYPLKKNFTAGLFAVISGVAIMASSIMNAVTAYTSNVAQENLILSIVSAAISVPAGLAMLLISRLHFTGKSTVAVLSIFNIFPSVWACSRIVAEFLQATKTSLAAKDVTLLFCYVYIALFLFSSSMVVSRIRGRNPVKGMFIYGLPMAALSITYGVFEIARMTREVFDRDAIFNALALVALGLYALFFIFEVFSNYCTKDEYEIMTTLSNGREIAFDDLGKEESHSGHVRRTEKQNAEDIKKGLVFAPENEQNLYEQPKDIDDMIFGFDDSGDHGQRRKEGYYNPQEGIEDLVFSDGGLEEDRKRRRKDSYYNPEEIDDLVFADDPSKSEQEQTNRGSYLAPTEGMDDFVMNVPYDEDETEVKKNPDVEPERNEEKARKKQEKAERRAVKRTHKSKGENDPAYDELTIESEPKDEPESGKAERRKNDRKGKQNKGGRPDGDNKRRQKNKKDKKQEAKEEKPVSEPENKADAQYSEKRINNMKDHTGESGSNAGSERAEAERRAEQAKKAEAPKAEAEAEKSAAAADDLESRAESYREKLNEADKLLRELGKK